MELAKQRLQVNTTLVSEGRTIWILLVSLSGGTLPLAKAIDSAVLGRPKVSAGKYETAEKPQVHLSVL